jgi:hypothetical protein
VLAIGRSPWLESSGTLVLPTSIPRCVIIAGERPKPRHPSIPQEMHRQVLKFRLGANEISQQNGEQNGLN